MVGNWVSKRPWEGGPVVTFEFLQLGKPFPFISIDLAISLELPDSYWPPNARQRPVGLRNARVQLVPKVKHVPNWNSAFWLISFAQSNPKS